MWNSAWVGFGPWPHATVLAQWPIPAQGAGTAVHAEHALCSLGGAVACSPPARWWPADSAVFTESSNVEWVWYQARWRMVALT
jgi:hypothetical protein